MQLRKFLVLPLLALSLRAAPAEKGQLDASPSLFTVMAALNAAGFDADANAPDSHALRGAIRQYLAGKNLASVQQLKRFVEEHKKTGSDGKRDWNAELRQYVSYALAVDGPPSFEMRFKAGEIPPDAEALEGFRELLTRFYDEADLGTVWAKAQPIYQGTIEIYQPAIIQSIMEVNGYLHNPTSGYLGRRFQVYVEPQLGPDRVQTRSYGDDYFVVVSGQGQVQDGKNVVLGMSPQQVHELRHAYLHFLLDPLATKYAEQTMKLRGLSDFAQGVPYLDESYKSDFLLMTTESLIRAIEARMMHAPEDKKQAAARDALREGFVLAANFAEQLPAYEKQQQAMRLYFPTMLENVDLRKEGRRLEATEFSQERQPGRIRQVTRTVTPELSPAEKRLAEADSLYDKKEYDLARKEYLELLKMTERKPLHAQAYYGLARIAARQRDPKLADELFRKALESGPEPQTKAWTLVYLGRLADAAADEGHEQAAKQFYRQALAVQGISDMARKAAETGLAGGSRKPE